MSELIHVAIVGALPIVLLACGAVAWDNIKRHSSDLPTGVTSTPERTL